MVDKNHDRLMLANNYFSLREDYNVDEVSYTPIYILGLLSRMRGFICCLLPSSNRHYIPIVLILQSIPDIKIEYDVSFHILYCKKYCYTTQLKLIYLFRSTALKKLEIVPLEFNELHFRIVCCELLF